MINSNILIYSDRQVFHTATSDTILPENARQSWNLKSFGVPWVFSAAISSSAPPICRTVLPYLINIEPDVRKITKSHKASMWKIPCFSFVSLFNSCQQSHTTKKGPGRSLRSAHWWGPSQFDQETKFPSPPSSYQMWQKALEKWRSSDCVDPGGNPSRRSKKCRALLGQERRTQRSQCVPSVLGATESQYVRHQDQCTPWITRTPGPVAVCPLLDAEEPTFQQDSTAAAEMLDQGKGWKGLHHKELGILVVHQLCKTTVHQLCKTTAGQNKIIQQQNQMGLSGWILFSDKPKCCKPPISSQSNFRVKAASS